MIAPTQIHELAGCTPTPLAHYLKALAVLRLIAEQADPQVRGWWKGERFFLLTRLDRPALLQFFLTTYAPTPLIAPWNGGSGFFPKDNTEGPDAIAHSHAARFRAYREALLAGKAITDGLLESPKKEAKAALIRRCRDTWRGPLAAWLNAVLVLNAEGEPAYPALLGTGGNDGRLDFTNNYMRRLSGLFDLRAPEAPAAPQASLHLESALFAAPTAGLESAAVGFFLPGGAGGSNQGAGFFAKELAINPWDFVLMLEGALLFRAALARRADAQGLPQASAPFALRPSAVGYGSAADADESARGEQWMPLWSAPTTYAEIAALFAEGRAQLAGRPATRPLDFARALARLGVARGIESFERFGYIERNGQANLAVPLGRWVVEPRPHQDLLDVIAPWVDNLRRAARDKNAPRSLQGVARACEEAMLACCRHSSALYWQALLLSLAEAEAALLHSPRFAKDRGLQPLPRLPLHFIDAASTALDPHSPAARELRLALSLASLHGPGPDLQDPIRRYWLPLDPKASYDYPRFLTNANALEAPPELVASGSDLLLKTIPLVLRRRALGRHNFPKDRHTLRLAPAADWAYARPDDLAAFLRGELNDDRILKFARAFMALDWREVAHQPTPTLIATSPSAPTPLPGLYGLLRLAVPFADIKAGRVSLYDPHTKRREPIEVPPISVKLDAAVLERLLADDLAGAFRVASDRLKIAGLRPRLLVAAAPHGEFVRRLTAALIFPLRDHDLRALALRLTKPEANEPEEPEEETQDPQDPQEQTQNTQETAPP
jgi:CRISPR-associated protein Csx17